MFDRTVEPVELMAVAIALVACVTDLRSRRIPNVLTLGGALAAVLFHTLTGGGQGLFLSVSGWLVGVLIFLAPFALGGLGGGDVKLVAALAAWLGPTEGLWMALYACVAGGVAALAVALVRGYLKQALSNIYLLLMHWRVAGVRPLHEVSLEGSTGPKLAYAIPVFGGLMVAIWLR